MPTRQEMWERLKGTFDVLIIGGGINGAGIARDAARRGLKVALVEMNDLAWGTSSRSSKLVHGGLRYLEYLEFSLVFESVSERRILLDIAPHLVNPLGFLFPVYKGARRGLLTVNAGMWLYEGLSLFRSPKRHRTLNRKELEELEPALKTDGLKGAPLFYDCSTDDARLTLESALDSVRSGAVITTYARAVEFLSEPSGRIVGIVAECQRTGERRDVHAHAIINATGPWTDQTMTLGRAAPESPMLRPTKGIHIVVERDKLPVNHAVTCFHPDDGRVLFAIPWGDRTYLGTTDTDYQGDPGDVAATLSDVDYLISVARHYFPEHPIGHDDVIATWAGLRPLIAPESDGSEGVKASAVSREHQILVGPDGLITVAGGKLTTYRRMSAEVVDTAVKLLRLSNHLPENLLDPHTDRAPLPGAVDWPEDDDHSRIANRIHEVAGEALSTDSARHLADTYGMLGIDLARRVRTQPELAQPLIDGRPEILAQIDWAVDVELACSLSDVMVRRTQLFYRDLDQGLGAIDRIASHMARLCDWSQERTQRELAEYRDTVELSRRWRAERTA